MSDARPSPPASRIVVSFDTTPVGEAALETALGLAAILDAEIAGLFVEDVGLVRMAELPFTRELGLASAILRPIDTADIERALRLQAEQSRAWLAAAAAALNLRWSFHVVRGQGVNAVFEHGAGCALVVLGAASAGVVARGIDSSAASPARRSVSTHQGFRYLNARPIVLIFDGSERGMRALAAGHALAMRAGTRLTLLVTAGSADEFDHRRQLARLWLVERGGAARYVWLKNRDVESVAQAVGVENASALLLHEDAAPSDRRLLRSLLAELGCPLVLVG